MCSLVELLLGHHAPGLRDIRAAARAMHHVLLARGLSIDAMRSLGTSNIGIVLNLTEVQQASDTQSDVSAKIA